MYHEKVKVACCLSRQSQILFSVDAGLSERTEVVAGARLEQQGAPDGLLWSGLQPQHLSGTTQEEVKIQDRGFQPLFLAPLPDCPLQPR